MNVAQLTIEMAANVARLRQDMDKARSVVESSTAKMAKAADMAKKALGAIGVALAAGAFASFVRGAINAADEMSKFSQRAGVAVKDVAGLQLAFRQSGIAAGNLEGSMARLNKGISEGNKAFELMGLATKNADGSLKSARQVLGEVADKFASYENGAAKAALAQQIFGRSGAEMIPLLNGGSKALDDFDAMAAKLGLTMTQETAQAAEKFNDTLDLMGQGFQGIARQAAAEILPTLQVLADKMFGAVTSGDRLVMVSKVISFALKALGTAFIVVIEIVSSFARAVITSFEAIRKVLSGDFSGAWETYKSGMVSNFDSIKQSLTIIGELWTETGSAGVASVAATTRALKDQAPVLSDNTKAQKDKLEAEKKAIELAVYKNKLFDKEFAKQERSRLAVEGQIKSAREMAEAIEFETSLLGMNTTEREIAVKMRELERQGVVEGTKAYDAYADSIRKAVTDQNAQKKNLENIEKQKKAYEDLWQSVDKEAENIFIDIAQNGEDAFKRIGQSIERYLLKMLYEMTVKQWIIQVSGVPGAGGAGGNMLSSFGSSALGGINIGGASLGAIGSSVGTGFTTTMMGGSVSGASAAYSSAGMSGVSAGLNAGAAGAYAAGILGGMAANRKLSGGYQLDNKHAQTIQDMAVIAATAFFGPLGGIAAGVGSAIVNRAFGRGAVKTGQTGITGTFSTEGASVRQFEEWSQKGGWFRSSRSGVNYSAVSNELDQFLDGSLIQITQATRMYAQILGLNADAVNGVTQSVRINLQGLNAEQQQESIMKALGGFADLLASRFGLTSETMAHLANSLATTNQVFETLNQRLFDTSLAAGEAASQLLELFGGVENFVQATSAYYRNFYTETERTTKATQQLTEVLAAMGFALPATRGEFRALVEAQDLMTTAGRQNYAALINLSQVFDEITPKLDTLAGKLGALVAGLVAELTTDLDKQINASADAARTARESARAYAEAARALGAAAQDILGGTTSTAQSLTLLRRAFGTQLASARSGNLDAMQGLGSTATDLQQAERDMAVTSVDFARQNALIALRLKEAAALAESSAAAADYQAMLFDVNTSMLQVLKDSLMSGSASVELLQEQLSALQYMANILANVDDGTQEQISMTDLVARATGGNEMLSAAILNQLQVPDAGSEFLSRTIALGNEFIAGRLDGVISAINQQTADQQAEIKRQQDLQKAHSQLDLLRERQALAISQVNTASQAIYGLAGRHGVFLNAQQGAVQLSNTARFGVDDKGLFEAAYNQISFTGSAQKSTNFRNDFYASGGLYDQTYGRASELRNLSAELEAQREAIRALGGVPAFAAGGMHSGGLRLVGERGPELEVTGPSRIFNANQTSAMLGGGGEVATEIRALRQEVTMLRHEAQATAINTGRTQDLMKRVTRNGEAMTVQTDGNKLEVTEL